jgi:hypothetical protein
MASSAATSCWSTRCFSCSTADARWGPSSALRRLLLLLAPLLLAAAVLLLLGCWGRKGGQLRLPGTWCRPSANTVPQTDVWLQGGTAPAGV